MQKIQIRAKPATVDVIIAALQIARNVATDEQWRAEAQSAETWLTWLADRHQRRQAEAAPRAARPPRAAGRRRAAAAPAAPQDSIRG